MNERLNNKAANRIGTGGRGKVNGGSIVERASQRKREKEKMVFNGKFFYFLIFKILPHLTLTSFGLYFWVPLWP